MAVYQLISSQCPACLRWIRKQVSNRHEAGVLHPLACRCGERWEDSTVHNQWWAAWREPDGRYRREMFTGKNALKMAINVEREVIDSIRSERNDKRVFHENKIKEGEIMTTESEYKNLKAEIDMLRDKLIGMEKNNAATKADTVKSIKHANTVIRFFAEHEKKQVGVENMLPMATKFFRDKMVMSLSASDGGKRIAMAISVAARKSGGVFIGPVIAALVSVMWSSDSSEFSRAVRWLERKDNKINKLVMTMKARKGLNSRGGNGTISSDLFDVYEAASLALCGFCGVKDNSLPESMSTEMVKHAAAVRDACVHLGMVE